MAISARAAGSWAASNATTQAVAVPAAQVTGDMMLCLFAVKPYSATPTIDNDWTAVGTFVADGTTANGDGVGSVLVGAFYKVAVSDTEANPTITWGTTSAPGAAVIVVFQKASTESWGTPVGAGGGDTSAGTGFSVTAGSDPGVTAGDMTVSHHGIRDNTTQTVPTHTQTGVTYAAVTEYPATALTSTTSNDIAADACYRLANSGTGSAAPVMTGTLSTSETGAAWFTRLRVIPLTNAPAGLASGTGTAYDATVTASGAGAAYVQSIGAANTTSSVSELALSVSKTVTAGNTIVVAVSMYADRDSTIAVVDNLGNTYTQVSGSPVPGSSPTRRLYLFSAPITTGGTLTSITASWTTATSYISVLADEFSGLGTPSAGGESTGTGTTMTWMPSGTIAANGAAVGASFSQDVRTHTAGSASGTPSTTITLGTANYPSDPSTSIAYAIAGGSDVTGFTGTTGNGLSTNWLGISAIFAAASGDANAPAGLASSTGAAQTAAASIAPAAGLGTATAAALAASASVKPSAGLSTGTGAALQASTHVQPVAGLGAATGAALQTTPNVGPVAGLAAATGTAYLPAVSIQATAGLASGAGTAQTAATHVQPTAGLAEATGTAYQPTVSTSAGTNAPAGFAEATGAAHQPTANPGVAAGLASGAGTAHQPGIHIQIPAGIATATGTAHQPTVSTSSSASAPAGLATASGTAHQAAASVFASAGRATGTGEAWAPIPHPAAFALVAAASGAAHDATVTVQTGVLGHAGLASGVGTAWPVRAGATGGYPPALVAGHDTPRGTATGPVPGLTASAPVPQGSASSPVPTGTADNPIPEG